MATKSPSNTPPAPQQSSSSPAPGLSTLEDLRATALKALAALIARFLVAFGATATPTKVALARHQCERLYRWAAAHQEVAFPAARLNPRRLANAYLTQLASGANGPSLERTAAIAAALCRLQAFADAEREGAFTARQSAQRDGPSTPVDPEALTRLATEYLAAPAGYLEGLGGELPAAVVYRVAQDLRRFARDRWHAASTAPAAPTDTTEGGAR
ncbi:hypothetical protein [Stigmatella erecta]|uniref:hypothetical protein n=1 Tax=Stigmatella erecta TaxID=83460 RepID=UPI001160104D|nr:hypothetical protein [Stigmatella erecta]